MYESTFKYTKYLTPMSIWFADLKKICEKNPESDLPFMLVYIALLIVELCLIDYRILPQFFHKIMTVLCCVRFPVSSRKDFTVEKEEKMIKDLISTRQLRKKMIVVDRIKRWYCSCKCSCKCKEKAVRGVSFTIDQQECFGLLGLNGAGKSTIFHIMTGTLSPSHGKIYVKSKSVTNCFERHNTFFKMGYCPQFGSYFSCFKGREMLEFFGRLRGLRGSQLKNEVDKIVKQILLQDYAEKNCKTYSGGTLRRMAVGIAIIGDPTIALLDEPTSGIDPPARRAIWNLISGYREKGNSILLTTHSMEECEALCSRLAIMDHGQISCIGDTTTLISTFGVYYTVILKLSSNATEEERNELKDAMLSCFGAGCILMDEHLTIWRYKIAKESADWQKLFTDLNSINSRFPALESFCASSATLEQIFTYFTKEEN